MNDEMPRSSGEAAAAAARAPEGDVLPALLPARMLNEFVYCPRLFYYEWVQGVFEASADTIEGQAQHRRVDESPGALPVASELEAAGLRCRSLSLTSERLGLTAKLDLVESDTAAPGMDGEAAVALRPVDYKRGRPRDDDGVPAAWPSDRVQVAVQAILLRENGYRCDEALLYYAATRQRVRIRVTDELVAEVLQAVADARVTAERAELPPPLEDSPKCPRCSLVGICLPDETHALKAREITIGDPERARQLSLFPSEPTGDAPPVRRMMTARDDLRPLYLNTQGMRVGKSGAVIQIRENDALKQQVRLGEVSQINLLGNVQLSTQVVQTLCSAEVPICYFSQGGWFYGITTGLNSRNVFLRRRQFEAADHPAMALELARALVAGKIRNQRVMIQRNHEEPPAEALRQLKMMAEKAELAGSPETLLGIEGTAARLYFGAFAGMLKTEEDGALSQAVPRLRFDFEGRNRRPPRDPVNALLSLAYSLLVKDLTITCYALGLEPYWGFFHRPRFGRPALALDLMEPFRPLIADSAVLSAINTRMVTPKDFIQSGPSVALTPEGRKGFFRAYELRMDSLVTHPLFDYRVSYRRLLEIQARLLGRWLEGEISSYPVFVTR